MKPVWSHWRSLKMTSFDMPFKITYCRSLIAMDNIVWILSCLTYLISKILRDLEGQWKSCYTTYDFLLMFHSKNGSMSCLLWDIQCRKNCDLEIPVKNKWRSLKVVPFDRPHLTFYWRFIVTIAISGVISEIWRNIGVYSQFSPTLPLVNALWRRTRQNFLNIFGMEKLEWWGYQTVEKF